MTFSDYLKRLYPFYGNGEKESDFIIRLLGSATTIQDDKVFDYKPEYLKRIYNGEKNINKKGASYILTHLDKGKFDCEFFNLLSDDSLIELCNEFNDMFCNSTRDNITQNLTDLFVDIMKSIANQTAMCNHESTTLPNNVCIRKTSLASDFNNVFIEVEQDKDLGLNNNNHIKTFHFNIENNAFSFDALGRYLQKNIGRYLYSRLQLDEFIKNEEQDTIALEAIKLLKQKINSRDKLDNELGNIVIYLFLENILNAPKLYTSIECGDNILDKAGVHLLTLNNENLSFQMIFSKSHITNNLRDSIDKVFVDLDALKKSQKSHSKFLETSILNQNFDDITSKKLKNIILPQKRDANISVNNAYGILLGYTIDVEQNVGNDDYPKNVKNQMIKDLQDNIAYIISKINQIGLQNSSFYIYLIPFNDADNEKSIIIKELVGGE